ncbi:MAG TPA: hypothetical protein DEP01_05830 [Aminobacterium sp.]|mgnify:CR=1 FL=1|jgi:hypothetical protein|uniref:hypothetical protein n=1 Tax=Aminobacterium TaxID=81466 RepID=UPI000EB9C837|nr:MULTISPECIES: hypothetical protein [unclassified Aminobacterium]HCA41044.1 hypothetical protein [Aminobacterium sp.]
MDWGMVPGETVVIKSKDITLRDIVQAIVDGADTVPAVKETFGLTDADEGVNDLEDILDVFVPAIDALRNGGCSGCGGGCSGCHGHC